MKSTIGEEIRKFRYELRRSQGQFGVMVGKSQRLISMWECGLAKPNAEMTAKIRRVMKIVRDAERAADEAWCRVLASEAQARDGR
jgi:transcriptional regulator with XRE-family HTH domain